MSENNSLYQICADLATFRFEPLKYVKWAFSWGKGPLINASGPKKWQADFLGEMGQELKEKGFDGINPVDPLRRATASGHGIGKSALVAWIIKWIMDTRPFSKGIITANTSDQLRTKTWAELAKWHNNSVTKDLFTYRSTRGNMCLFNNQYPETWRCDALTCKEENSEAFAGLHSAGSTPFFLFDEGSAIPEKIYEVAQGGLTDGEPIFLIFGNPTRNTGYFHNCFTTFAHRYKLLKIDSRNVEGASLKLFEQWIEDYGEDSDYVRVRIKGQFPRVSILQLISTELVKEARSRIITPVMYRHLPRVLGADVAWEGDDRACQWVRQGVASKLLWQNRECDSIIQASLLNDWESRYNTDATFIDAGMGTGVIDQLRLLGRSPIPVWFNGKSTRSDCRNKRAQMWVDMRDWLELGGAIPDLDDVAEDLISVEYFTTENGQMQLERKKDMKKRLGKSPDLGDGLALTFAEKVEVKRKGVYINSMGIDRMRTEYDVLSFGSSSGGEFIKTEYDVL